MSQRKKAAPGRPGCPQRAVPGPCWHVPSGSAGPAPVMGAVSHRRRAPQRGPDGAARAGRGGSAPSHGKGSPGPGCCHLCPPGTPPPTHGPSPQHAGPLLSSHGMQREGGAPHPHGPGFAARHGRRGRPRQRLAPVSRPPPRETASLGPAGGMEPLMRVSSPVPSKAPNLGCKMVCTHCHQCACPVLSPSAKGNLKADALTAFLAD